MNKQQQIKAELKKEGLRLANENEAGWYVKVIVNGQIVTVWATD